MAHYPPPHYDEPDRRRQLRLIREQPLATFVVAGADGRPYATPVPLVVAARDARDQTAGTELQLVGHLDANNPAAALVTDGREALAIFHGPSAYISPRDYHSRQLPTYNYEQVHVRGTLERLDDPARIDADLHALIAAMEGVDGWRLAPDDPRIAALLPHIVAFRCHVTAMTGRFKLSQDKRPADRAAAARKLDAARRGGPRQTHRPDA